MRFVLLPLLVLSLVHPAHGQSAPTEEASAPSSFARLSDAAQSLAQQVRRAVVQVKVRRVEGLQGSGEGSTQLAEVSGSGSGVIVDSTGFIVTNAHVVSEATEVWVQRATPTPPPPGEKSILRRRGSLLKAEVVGIDPETDVAVLDVPGTDYPTLPFGNSDRLRRGQVVFAFGSPMGLENSMTMGIVSATARQMRPGDPMVYVQTDTPINPGNSGGPLVNQDGEMVGLNTFNVSQSGESAGLGFAGPSNIVEAVYRQIRAHGSVRRGVIGANAQTVTPELAQTLSLSQGYRVILADVYPGSPAERAGLRPGDVVTHLNGERMHNGRELDVNLYPKAGTTVTLGIVREDSTFEARVPVVQRRGGSARFAEMATPEKHLVARLGILGLPLTDEVAKHLSSQRLPSGVVVAASNRPPAPWGDGLQPGDVIYTIDGQRVESPSALRSLIDAKAPDDRVLAHVLRDGTMHYLVLPAG
ncbi:trypsin-like peptidase domain-containing protein [Salinibacter altiplanensis]|uniref:trypsin-like peptidase domain-containing protein n=1 Tax=Salinibacter altiplanensis TaxID=1803181 RepID=UPI00131A5F6A|nr:trypsin-like peptidase domain-containing protein [Salinibacter altiplanensis]